MKLFYRYIYFFVFLTIILIFFYQYFDLLNNILLIKKNNFSNDNKIAIVMIFDGENFMDYEVAINTTYCYSLQYNYMFEIIDESDTSEYSVNCLQKDFMFRRHCILANFASKFDGIINYILFIDGDVGVINPLHKIEEYLPKNDEEIIFYDRIFNKEIAAGSYIMRNSFFTRNLLNSFANYEVNVSSSNDGRDNVALQVVILNLLNITMYVDEYDHCMELYKHSVGYDQNMMVVSCTRWILNRLDETPYNENFYTYKGGKIRIVRKLSSKRWVRDAFLTLGKFCDNDFLHHGWKSNIINQNKYEKIFKSEFNPSDDLCRSSNFLSAWNLNLSSKVTCDKIDYDIKMYIYYADMYDIKHIYLSNITKFLDLKFE
uniref:Nucleotid_trans domain-containing protein n=1 Tax=Strongyloides stercoralis TaxID=6248 RepID=A0A913IAS6_STRER